MEITMTNLSAAYKEGCKELQIVGFLCWWSVRNVDIIREKLIEILKACDINEKYARSHNYRAAFIRSLRELEENRIIRPVEEDKAGMTYQFTAETRVEARACENVTLEYNPETLVVIDKIKYKKTQSIAEAITGRADIRQRLIELFEEKKNQYHSSDITRMIQRIFSEKADIVSLRETGGIYYVPTEFDSVLRAVAKFVNSIGDSTFEFFPLPDVESCRKAVASAVDNEMRVDLEKMDEEMKLVQNGEKEVTNRWRNNKAKVLEKLNSRILRYQGILTEESGIYLTDNFERMKADIMKTRDLDL
jgi:hypothetical protein